MIILPTLESHMDEMNNALKKIEDKIDFLESNLNIIGSNANVIANSIFQTSNYSGMYNHLKNSSNILKIVSIPPQ